MAGLAAGLIAAVGLGLLSTAGATPPEPACSTAECPASDENPQD